MSKFTTPDLGVLKSVVKVTHGNSKYQPLELTDEAVYDMARHWYTLDEIAARFNVSHTTITNHHDDAFQKGKADGFNKPRMLLAKIFTDFAESELNFANPTVPVPTLLKAIELHAKKYEGLGKEQNQAPVNPPSVSEIKFEPLEASNED